MPGAVEFGAGFNRAGFKQPKKTAKSPEARRPNSSTQPRAVPPLGRSAATRPMSAAPARTITQKHTSAARPVAVRPSTAHAGGRRSSRSLYQRLPTVGDSRIQHSVKQLPPKFRDSRPNSAHAPGNTIQGIPRTDKPKRPKRTGRRKRKMPPPRKLPVLQNQTHREPLESDGDHTRRADSLSEPEQSPLYLIELDSPVAPLVNLCSDDESSDDEIVPVIQPKELEPMPPKQQTADSRDSPDIEIPAQQSLMQLCQKLHDDNSMLRSKFAGMISLVHKSNERGAKFDLERRALECRVEDLKKELVEAKSVDTYKPAAKAQADTYTPVVEAAEQPTGETTAEVQVQKSTSKEDTQIWKGVRKFSAEYFALTMFKHNDLPVIRFVAQKYSSDSDINEVMQTLYLVLPTIENDTYQTEAQTEEQTVAWCTDAVHLDEKTRELEVGEARLVSSYAAYQEGSIEQGSEEEESSKPLKPSPSPTWKGARKFGSQYTLLTLTPLPSPDHHKMLLAAFNVQSSAHSSIEIELPLLHRWSFAYMDAEAEDDTPHVFPEAVATWCLERVDLGPSGELVARLERAELVIDDEDTPSAAPPKPKVAMGFKMLDVKKPGDKEGAEETEETEEDAEEIKQVPAVKIEGVSFPLMHCEVYTLWRAGKRIGGLYYLMGMEFSSQLNAGTVIVSKTRAGESEPQVIHLHPPKDLVLMCYESRRLAKMRDWGLAQLKTRAGWF